MEVLIYALEIAGIGISVVFMALVVIGGVVGLFPQIDEMIQNQLSGKAKALPSAETASLPTGATLPSTETASDQIPPEIVAAITAAVSVATDQRFRIRAIRYRRTPTDTSTWALQGRATIMASHAINPQTK